MYPEALTYSSSESAFLTWEFNCSNASSQLTALLAAIFSFQASALIYDVFQGVKPKNASKVSDLHISLLIRKSSILTIAVNLLRVNWLTRAYYGRDIPRDVEIARYPQRIQVKVATKLLFFLLVAPVINVITIFLNLHRERSLTFAEAGFVPVTLTATKPVSTLTPIQTLHSCENIPVKLQPGDTSLVRFSLCSQLSHVISNAEYGKRDEASVRVHLANNASFVFVASIKGIERLIWASLVMFTNNTMYPIKAALTKEEIEGTVDSAVSVLGKACGVSENFTASEIPPRNKMEGLPMILKKGIACPEPESPKRKINDVLLSFRRHIGITVTSTLLATQMTTDSNGHEIPELPFRNGSNMVFLARSTKKLSLLTLLILCVITIFLRSICSFILNNDVDIGLERIIKARLGYECCQSMLSSGKDKVRYNCKHQLQKTAHYGLPRNELREVEQLSSGIVGTETKEFLSEA